MPAWRCCVTLCVAVAVQALPQRRATTSPCLLLGRSCRPTPDLPPLPLPPPPAAGSPPSSPTSGPSCCWRCRPRCARASSPCSSSPACRRWAGCRRLGGACHHAECCAFRMCAVAHQQLAWDCCGVCAWQWDDRHAGWQPCRPLLPAILVAQLLHRPPLHPAALLPLQGDGVKSIIIPGIVGVILGLGLGMLIFYT